MNVYINLCLYIYVYVCLLLQVTAGSPRCSYARAPPDTSLTAPTRSMSRP